MFVSTAFITSIKYLKKKKMTFSSTALPLALTTPDPHPQGQFKTEPVHRRFHRKQPVPGKERLGEDANTVQVPPRQAR